MNPRRRLIVNADDFGLSSGVNRGISRAHEQGLVTSASLMVRWPAAAEAAAYSREHPGLSLGLHCDLGEWACRDTAWVAVYEVVPLHQPTAVREELERQLAAFRRLAGRSPTHLDSHQHVHRKEPARSILVDLGRTLGIPVRHYSGVHYCGDFYGQGADGTPYPEILSVEGFRRILASLPAGLTELACHPGEDGQLDTMYCQERSREVDVLCDPRARAALAELGISLCSFADIHPKEALR
jgi:predicted glycoside hydrolase/deacetylase ChbG (UPF0249 family)